MEGRYTALNENLVSDRDEKDKEAALSVAPKKKGPEKQWLYLVLVVLAIVAVSAIITVIGLAIALGVRSSRTQTTSPDSNTCLTQGCVQLAAQMTAAMNQSVDPCEDFYQFSCGNWANNNVLPEDADLITQLSKPQTPIYQKLAALAKKGYDGGTEAVRKAFYLYRSCMDEAAIEDLGVTPLRNLIAERLGGWPLLGIPETTPWSINSPAFFYEKTHGSLAFFNFLQFFNAVTMNRSRYALYFQQTSSTLLMPPRNETVVELKDLLTVSFNSSVNPITVEETIQRILDFDVELNRIREPPSNVPDIVNGNLLNESNVYTFERLRTLWPGFDWQGFINYIYNLSGLAIPQNLEIVVTTPAYFQRLGPLLQNTDPGVIRDYARLLFLTSQLSRLSSEFAAKRTAQVDPMPGNLVSCMDYVQRTLPIALARPFVELYVPKGTKERVSMMMGFILKGFRERVNQMNWLSDLSKQRSIEKVDAIISQAAYPAQIFDDDYVNGLYTTFTANPNDFFGNRLRADELTLHLRLNLTHSFDKLQWATEPLFQAFPTVINAAYVRNINEMYVQAAIATEPIFSANWPDYFMFGALGAIVGHEITHGFDSNGQTFDQDGVRRMWWSNESQAEFNSRLQCFINQYNNYTVMGEAVNGQGTLAENIADNGGLLASFRAYRMRAATAPQQMLPSLPYTPEQLFFIAFGQLWCDSVSSSLVYRALYSLDNHAPGPIRVLTVANSPEFAEVFNCPAGSPMNPTKKCTLW